MLSRYIRSWVGYKLHIGSNLPPKDNLRKEDKALLPKCPLFGASTVVNIGGSFEMFRDHVSWYKFVQLGIQLSDQWLFGDPFLNVDSNPFCLNCSLNPLVFSLFLWWPGTPPPKPKRPPKELVVRYRVQEQEQEEVRPRSASILQALFRKWALFGEQVQRET